MIRVYQKDICDLIVSLVGIHPATGYDTSTYLQTGGIEQNKKSDVQQ